MSEYVVTVDDSKNPVDKDKKWVLVELDHYQFLKRSVRVLNDVIEYAHDEAPDRGKLLRVLYDSIRKRNEEIEHENSS